MKIMYFFAVLYLGILGIYALFNNLVEKDWLLRLLLGLFACLCLVFTIAYQNKEKKTEDIKKEYAYRRADSQMQEIKGKLDNLNEKEKRGLFKDIDYLNRIALELDALNLNLEKREPIIKEQYLTIYFREVDKIPKFYNWEEWKESENILFIRMFNNLKGYFNLMGMLSSGEMKVIENEFNKEREKYLKAKERELKK